MDAFKDTIYIFGSSDGFSLYGYMTFGPEGKILGYQHSNESTYELQGDRLTLFNSAGEVSRVFSRHGNAFIGKSVHDGWEFFLIPLLTIDHHAHEHDAALRVFVNSIPKTGTYFLEQILMDLGYRSLRLHVSGNNATDDYRGLEDSQIHVAPQRVRRNFPITLLAHHVRGGEFIVGHVEDRAVLEEYRSHGISIISTKRNLRDVLVSLYRFKLEKVHPVGLGDETWRLAGDEDRFISFLAFYAERDVAHIRSMAEVMADETDALRYEDLNENKRDAAVRLASILKTDGDRVETMIAQAKNKDTPTKTRERLRCNWDNRAEAFFRKSGLHELNRKLGYESA